LDDPGQTSRPDRYIIPDDHDENLWNLDEAPTPARNRNHNHDRNQPEVSSSSSSAALFGGIESLVAESQGWWLRDHANFFDNWYGSDQTAAAATTMIAAHGLSQQHDLALALMNHGGIDSSYPLDGSGPGRPAY
jgi:hypothetical protein